MKWKVLKTESDYKIAIKKIEEIFESEPKNRNYDELELLALLIKDYEDKFYPMPLPDPIEVIKFKMIELGMKNKDLIPIIGSEGHVSSVLSGRRKITLDMAKSISKLLQIPADIFINENTTFESYMPENENTKEVYLSEQFEVSKERIIRLHALNQQMESSSSKPSPAYPVSIVVQQLYETVVKYETTAHKPQSKSDDPAKSK